MEARKMNTKKNIKKHIALFLSLLLLFHSLPLNYIYADEHSGNPTNNDNNSDVNNGTNDGEDTVSGNDITPTDTPTPSPTGSIKETIEYFYKDSNKYEDEFYDVVDVNYADKNTIKDLLPSEIYVKISNKDDPQKISNLNWTCKDNPIYTTKLEYIYTLDTSNLDYEFAEDIVIPKIKYSIYYEIEYLTNYNIDEPYKNIIIDYNEKSDIDNILPNVIETKIKGITEYVEIPTTWHCRSDFENSYDLVYYFDSNISNNYHFPNDYVLPYIQVTITKTITSYANSEGTSPIDVATQNYLEYNIKYRNKQTTVDSIPSFVYAYINENPTVQQIPIKWTCDKDILHKNEKQYIYKGYITDSETKVSSNITATPQIVINIEQEITSFVGYNHDNGALQTLRVDKDKKSTINSLLPTKLTAYINGYYAEETEIPVTWSCTDNINDDSKIQFKYDAIIDSSYKLSDEIKDKLPYINVIILDPTKFSNEKETYGYSGKIETYVAPLNGNYLVKAWGAQGGGDGGLGGYTERIIQLQQGDTIYIAVGGQGSYQKGGWNGGGNATSSNGGGGATHISRQSGLLKDVVGMSSDLILVAGGGGGGPQANEQGGYTTAGGGGGLEGTGSFDGSKHTDDIKLLALTGGTQSTGYAQGYGEPSTTTNGAGGGGYYGGFVCLRGTDYRGGGGSGYVGDTTVTTSVATSSVRKGNGAAEIEYKGNPPTTLILDLGTGGTWNNQSGTIQLQNSSGTVIDIPNPTEKTGYKFIGWTVEYGDGQIVNGKYTFTFQNTKIKAKYLATLYLTSEKENTKLNLAFSQDDEYTKTYRVYQSTDKVNWYLADSNTTTPSQVYEYPYSYTGVTKKFTAQYDGAYQLQVWGAQGGGGVTNKNKGGYVTGSIVLRKGDTLFVSVGGTTTTKDGGWNGGGSNNKTLYGGGGATDIALQGEEDSTTWNTTKHLYSRIIVAGAGGGYNKLGKNEGGAGGFTNGQNGGGDDYGSGATQTQGGDTSSDNMGSQKINGGFGFGGSNYWCDEYLGGGGAGWYGGGAGGGHDNNGSGGGGSGYAWSAAYAQFYPTTQPAYKPNTRFYLSNIDYEDGVQSGDGYAKITFRDLLLTNPYLKDVIMKDLAAPNSIDYITLGGTDDEPVISWDVPNDNGTMYYHQVKSYEATDTDKPIGVSNITEDNYVSGVMGYYYRINAYNYGTVNKNDKFSSTNTITTTKSNYRTYLHIAAVDYAGNIGPTRAFVIEPVTYHITYNSNQKIDTGIDDVSFMDDRTFYYDTDYYLKGNIFEKNGKGFYGQTLHYNFIGWGLKAYSPFLGTDENYPYKYKDKLTIKETDFMNTSPMYIKNSVMNNPKESIYFYNYEKFKSLTRTKKDNITLYAQWIADNQKPYGGFTFSVLEYNDDGTSTGEIKQTPNDSYDLSTIWDTSKTLTAYDDVTYFINTQYKDPEGLSCTAEYQYSIDNGNTWYLLTSNITSSHRDYINTRTWGNLLGLTFGKDKTVLVRLRLKDTVKYPIYYEYNPSTNSSVEKSLQKSMWSTGYFVDNSHVDYDSTGKYLGDYGTKGNQGGSWYVKTIRCVEGNKAPITDLVGDLLDTSSFNINDYTYQDILTAMRNQNFLNFPMYDYTKATESYGYKDGTLYILVPKNLENNASNDSEIIKNFFDKNEEIFKYVKNTPVKLIKESNDYRYTTFIPEDESIAFLNASIDEDAIKHVPYILNNNDRFSHYWISIIEHRTSNDVLTVATDNYTTYNNETLDTSSGTIYYKNYDGSSMKGHIYDTYEEMVEDIYKKSNGLFATKTDKSLTIYDVYFSVCDKSWNDVSPNKWGAVVKKTIVVEPELTIYDVLINDEKSTTGDKCYSAFKNASGVPYYHIGGYTNYRGMYQNIDNNFLTTNGRPNKATMLTRHENSQYDYVVTDKTYTEENGKISYRYGYNIDLDVMTHGCEKATFTLYDKNDAKFEVIPKYNQSGTYSDKTYIEKGTRTNVKEDKFYSNTTFTFAIPEQSKIEGFYVAIEITKSPYTRPGTILYRAVQLGDKDNLLTERYGNMTTDIGINLVN